MKILVRLPNWLGDMVMSVGFLHQLNHSYPNAEISVIAKQGIHELLDFSPPLRHRFIFSKKEYKGIAGLWKFGRMIRQVEQFDLFFCLPDSFSSALMARFIGSKKRVGYKNEFRSILLTNTFVKPAGLHRAEEYVLLIELYKNIKTLPPNVRLVHSFFKADHIVVNINSEASSRRLTIAKAKEIIDDLRAVVSNQIILIGAPKEKGFVEEVMRTLNDKSNIESYAGNTNLTKLAELLASARAMLTTDSGPAHLANALGTPTVVLFGAGNEHHTAPYIKELSAVIRLGKLSCEPCTKNVCVRYGIPQCLERLDSKEIITLLKKVADE